MREKLSIVGGTYYEVCTDLDSEELYGSALRAAAALSGKQIDLKLFSCLDQESLLTAQSLCETFGIAPHYHHINETIVFKYYHPLSQPQIIGISENLTKAQIPPVHDETILYYGMIEASASVHGKYVIYDPQNHIAFTDTGSTADHLALILNRNEACLLSRKSHSTPLKELGQVLLTSQKAEVVVIKNGSKGAAVISHNSYQDIPIFETSYVWPIGSGDIFSAVFAWKWAIEKLSPYDASMLASIYTATYCQTKLLPLPKEPISLTAIVNHGKNKKIYLAGPFFSMSQRWLINEIREILLDFGNIVFSPLHDIGFAEKSNLQEVSKEIASQDLNALQHSDVVLAIVDDKDPGTLFEIGFAKANGKKVIVYSENLTEEDLLMFRGTGCIIEKDFSTAIYMASW